MTNTWSVALRTQGPRGDWFRVGAAGPLVGRTPVGRLEIELGGCAAITWPPSPVAVTFTGVCILTPDGQVAVEVPFLNDRTVPQNIAHSVVVRL